MSICKIAYEIQSMHLDLDNPDLFNELKNKLNT
nr:MAG TPA: hypothetical protein [Caudoviricetes sp.]